ncbi:hypothetical protein EDD85DRAFT_944527 [Armillaria nabsnona]|nr:hypothetical protein EDD85DRAFT_944527 [Armillaria nabsnona]
MILLSDSGSNSSDLKIWLSVEGDLDKETQPLCPSTQNSNSEVDSVISEAPSDLPPMYEASFDLPPVYEAMAALDIYDNLAGPTDYSHDETLYNVQSITFTGSTPDCATHPRTIQCLHPDDYSVHLLTLSAGSQQDVRCILPDLRAGLESVVPLKLSSPHIEDRTLPLPPSNMLWNMVGLHPSASTSYKHPSPPSIQPSTLVMIILVGMLYTRESALASIGPILKHY